MFQYGNQSLYVPIVGTFSYKKLLFFSYEIKPEIRFDEREEFIKFKFDIKEYFKNENYFPIQEEDLLIFVMKDIKENFRNNIINNQRYRLESKSIPDVKYPHLIVLLINEIFNGMVKENIFYKLNQLYILEKEKISESKIKDLDIQLFKHKAIRFSIYIDKTEKEFLVLLYPSFKLVIEPTIEQFIAKKIDIMNLSVISSYPDFPSGDIVEIVEKPNALIKQEILRLIREMKYQSIKITPTDALIKIKTTRKVRDQFYPAHVYNIQAKMDDEVFEQEFDWDLGDIQEQLQFTPDSFYNTIEPYRRNFTNKINEILNKK